MNHTAVATTTVPKSEVSRPVCVDLDGSVVLTDTFVECVRVQLQENPRFVFTCLASLMRDGRARTKQMIASRVSNKVEDLPYCDALLKWLGQLRTSGRKLILVTGADESIANKVAAHLGLFDEVVASNGALNLTGKRKAEALVHRFGEKGFDYVGNSMADIPVWRRASGAIAINPGWLVRLLLALYRIPLIRSFRTRRMSLLVLVKALRVYQWSKNLLVLLPLLTSHQFTNVGLAFKAIGAALAFSLVASSMYLVNDVVDVEADRNHPVKCRRPVAAGLISQPVALLLSVCCLFGGITAAAILSSDLALVLGMYAVMASLYSFKLKSMMYVDVLVLCVLYAMRIFAGGLAANIVISPWLLQFSLYGLLSLSIAKRYSELGVAQRGARTPHGRRAYLIEDMDQLALAGTVTGTMSVLVIALYIHSPDVALLYREPQFLWALCPIILYWFLRLWGILRRGVFIEDPIVFATSDRATIIAALLCFVAVLIAC